MALSGAYRRMRTVLSPGEHAAGDQAFDLALPDPSRSFEQDAEWFVIRSGGRWRQIRFHDYGEIYSIPGLYEHLFYRVLQCNSPAVLRAELEAHLRSAEHPVEALRVLDLGAGNGMVAEELRGMGARTIVGIDILSEAAEAAERDRPGVYSDYFVLDLTQLVPEQRRAIREHRLNCLVSVAALGFGDIPSEAFIRAYELIDDGGWVAFTIKEDFVAEPRRSEFAQLIARAEATGALDVHVCRRFRHRMSTSGTPLPYLLYLGRKRGELPQ